MQFVLRGNTYVHRDDVGNPKHEDEDQHMDDIHDEEGPPAPVPVIFFYSLESMSRQLCDMSLLQVSRQEEVCSLLKSLDDRVQVLEDLVQPLDDGDSDELYITFMHAICILLSSYIMFHV